MRFLVLLALWGCGSKAMTIAVNEPSTVVVSYISGHSLYPGSYLDVELRTDAGDVVRPAEEKHWQIEAHRTTKFYVLRPGTYRLVNHRNPVVKALRRRSPRLLASERVASQLDARTDNNDERGVTTESWRIARQGTQPYFVLLEEHRPDASDDFRVRVIDAEGRPVPIERYASDHREPVHVGGVRWLGPLVGSTMIELSMWGTTARRYSLHMVQ